LSALYAGGAFSYERDTPVPHTSRDRSPNSINYVFGAEVLVGLATEPATLYTRAQRGWRHASLQDLHSPTSTFGILPSLSFSQHVGSALESPAMHVGASTSQHGQGYPCTWHAMDLGTSYRVPPLSAKVNSTQQAAACGDTAPCVSSHSGHPTRGCIPTGLYPQTARTLRLRHDLVVRRSHGTLPNDNHLLHGLGFRVWGSRV
jgi:hypothetical protein